LQNAAETKYETVKRELMNAHIGSSFDSFLEEEGIKEEVENTAVKKIISNHRAIFQLQAVAFLTWI